MPQGARAGSGCTRSPALLANTMPVAEAMLSRPYTTGASAAGTATIVGLAAAACAPRPPLPGCWSQVEQRQECCARPAAGQLKSIHQCRVHAHSGKAPRRSHPTLFSEIGGKPASTAVTSLSVAAFEAHPGERDPARSRRSDDVAGSTAATSMHYAAFGPLSWAAAAAVAVPCLRAATAASFSSRRMSSTGGMSSAGRVQLHVGRMGTSPLHALSRRQHPPMLPGCLLAFHCNLLHQALCWQHVFTERPHNSTHPHLRGAGGRCGSVSAPLPSSRLRVVKRRPKTGVSLVFHVHSSP